MPLDTTQAVDIIKAAGDTIKKLADGYDTLNQQILSYKSADEITDAELEKLKTQATAANALLTSGPTTEVGEVVEDNPTPATDGAVKAINEALEPTDTDAPATPDTVDTTDETPSSDLDAAVDSMVEAVESATAPEPAAEADSATVVSDTDAEPSEEPNSTLFNG